METGEYVAAYRRIIPPNLARWVLFRHGTVYVLEENASNSSIAALQEEAVAYLGMHGPILVGSSGADFEACPLKDDLGWLVMYPNGAVFNFIPAVDCPDPSQGVVAGLQGRDLRARDAVDLDVVHIERPAEDGAS